jgi:hypothetical protein
MKTLFTKFMIWLTIIVAYGCAGQVDVAPPADAAPACSIIGYESRGMDAASSVWQFSDASTPNPNSALCDDLGDGVFSCRPEACLVTPVAGSCPACYAVTR